MSDEFTAIVSEANRQKRSVRRATFVSVADSSRVEEPIRLTDGEKTDCQKLITFLTSSDIIFTKSEFVATMRLLDLTFSTSVMDKLFHLVDADDSSTICCEEFISLMEYIKGNVDDDIWQETLIKLEYITSEGFRGKDTEAFRHLVIAEQGSNFSLQTLYRISTWLCILYYFIVSPLHLPADSLYGSYQSYFIGWEAALTLVAAYDFQKKYRQYTSSDDVVMNVRQGKKDIFVALLSATPLDIISYLWLSSSITKLGYCIRISHLLKLNSFYSLEGAHMISRETVRSAFGWFPLLRFSLWAAFGIHFIACTREMINCHEIHCDGFTFERYEVSLYWTLYTLSSVGYGDIEVRGVKSRLLANCGFVAAILWNGILVGKIASFMVLDTAGEHRQLMSRTAQVIQHYHVPGAITDDILTLQQHLLSQKIRLRSVVEVVNLLPPVVQESMCIYIKVEALNRLPIFSQSNMRCKIALAECLQNRIVDRDMPIVVEGEEGNAMYFLSHGFAGVTIENRHIAILSKGSFFGEMCLLIPGNQRAATVSSATLCELLVLEASDFITICETFPSLKWHIECGVHRRIGSLPENMKQKMKVLKRKPQLNDFKAFLEGDTVQEHLKIRRRVSSVRSRSDSLCVRVPAVSRSRRSRRIVTNEDNYSDISSDSQGTHFSECQRLSYGQRSEADLMDDLSNISSRLRSILKNVGPTGSRIIRKDDVSIPPSARIIVDDDSPNV